METSYQVIDRKTWKRNMHCQIFQNSLEPQYCISLELDITNFLKMVKKNNYSFTFAFIYAVCKCANEIEEFRYRFLDDEVVLYDTIHTGCQCGKSCQYEKQQADDSTGCSHAIKNLWQRYEHESGTCGHAVYFKENKYCRNDHHTSKKGNTHIHDFNQ